MAGAIKVLSIDGGGIRGIIPAMVLAEIETRAGKPISELFDLISGTSTGGVLALGLVTPDGTQPRYTAEDLFSYYQKDGPRIFSRSIWHRASSLDSVLEEKYPSENIDKVLEERFGDTRLKEALTPVLITSYDIERRLPFFFRSERARRRPDYDFPMSQVARATSAAPTYFEPIKIDAEDSQDYYALIDGGVFANNPAMCAYVEARGCLDAEHSAYSPGADVRMVSLGTGELTRPIPYEEAKDWGLLGWARPILSILFDGVSATVDYQMNQLLHSRDGARRYYRFQTRLNEGNDDRDDASDANLRALQRLGETLVKENTRAIDDLCARLVE
jgi:patatin-like phospholipase/acyl hydrolase